MARPRKNLISKSDLNPNWLARIKELKRLDRLMALMHYGGNPPKCACCETDIYPFLGIDHIDGHQGPGKKLVGESLYRWLKNNNYPPGFQVLCHNCNMAKGFYGKCPHEELKALDEQVRLLYESKASSSKIDSEKTMETSTNLPIQ